MSKTLPFVKEPKPGVASPKPGRVKPQKFKGPPAIPKNARVTTFRQPKISVSMVKPQKSTIIKTTKAR